MQTRILIDGPAAIIHAQQLAGALAVRCGFGEIATERLGQAAVAAAEGMLDHAGGGTLYLRPLQEEVIGAAAPQVELIALDRDTATGGRSGPAGEKVAPERLTVLSTLASALDSYDSGRGCALRIALSPADRPMPMALPPVVVGVVGACGEADGVAAGVNIQSARGLANVVMGLGRGADAARRVAALQGFGARVQQIERVRGAMPAWHGMALAAAQMEAAEGRVRVVGAGRFGACVLEPAAARAAVRRPLCRADGQGPAQIDGRPGPMAQAQGAWPRHSLLVLHGDDLAWPWTLEALPGLLERHPSIVAAVLHRDFSRTPGSGCVLACRRSDECLPLAVPPAGNGRKGQSDRVSAGRAGA